MGILAGSWAVTGIDMLMTPDGSTSAGLGAQLLVTAAAMALAGLLAAVRGSLLPAVVIAGAAIRFAATGAYELSASTAWERAAGWIGVALAALAACVAATLGWEAARRERRGAGA
jgi:hypothetical protein